MGILRLGIIAAVGVALLPSDSEQQEILYNRAALAAEWTVTFCDRNVQTCTVAAGAWDGFKKKAQFGARLAWDTVAEQLGPEQASATADTAAAYKPAGGGRVLETGTLKPTDFAPQWRGGHGRNKPAARLDAKGGS